MFYHEVLGIAVETVASFGVCPDSVGYVRDGTGRLLVVAEDIPDKAQVGIALKDKLGSYAASVPLITGEVAKKVLEGPSSDRVVHCEGRAWQVRYFDRRLVGADWLHQPAQKDDAVRVPTIVFGSLKGGVGRSTAMSVLCADLTKSGKRVLAVDLDIEAPGLGFMLLPQGDTPENDRRPKFGTVDYLVEHGIGGVPQDALIDFLGVSPYLGGLADVVPAVGRLTDDEPHLMMEKLSRALVEDLTSERKSVLDQVRTMIDALSASNQYDVVLIDARAGLGEISAAPLLGLGADVVLFATDQSQTFRGYRYLLAHMRQNFMMSDEGDWRQKLHFVQAKAPSASSRRLSFRERLYEICAEFLYDEERLDQFGQVVRAPFNPSPDELGYAVPHDASFVEFHPNYDAFDPTEDGTQLDREVYRGPYGAFLNWAWGLLGFVREEEVSLAD
ncbi:tyrosine-protein kinase family protein [Brevundimonas sp. GW460-12-10-14-LB2]|uniref:tyrosine-protein kinase family protein n=1 Tax=Brevundimonas sp. GW460-12-10-14-LB2 TaxID=1827469 RepID=UPI000A7DF2E5|nr:AAA family ATPase [Brevundimonas sp. GW460-12-10-14-LB2]